MSESHWAFDFHLVPWLQHYRAWKNENHESFIPLCSSLFILVFGQQRMSKALCETEEIDHYPWLQNKLTSGTIRRTHTGRPPVLTGQNRKKSFLCYFMKTLTTELISAVSSCCGSVLICWSCILFYFGNHLRSLLQQEPAVPVRQLRTCEDSFDSRRSVRCCDELCLHQLDEMINAGELRGFFAMAATSRVVSNPVRLPSSYKRCTKHPPFKKILLYLVLKLRSCS